MSILGSDNFERKITQNMWKNLIDNLISLEERIWHNELAIERLEHSEDKEYLESIERCKECSNRVYCKNLADEVNKKICNAMENNEEKSKENNTCENCISCRIDFSANLIRHYCDNELSKYYRVRKDFTCNLYEEKLKVEKTKQGEWIVHRTLRKQGKETYVRKPFLGTHLNSFTYNIKDATRFTREESIVIRDELNKNRIGKRFLWVVSKV